jgi:hypothetical protein
MKRKRSKEYPNVHLFVYWYNHMRPHETFTGKVP